LAAGIIVKTISRIFPQKLSTIAGTTQNGIGLDKGFEGY
jgi:hypothetical protein